MPIHDWTRVDAGIFHHFHHEWISEIARALNRGLLPSEYYAMAEQRAAGLHSDVLTLQGQQENNDSTDPDPAHPGEVGLLLAPPKLRCTAETDRSFHQRRQSSVVVRHVSGDRVVAMVEIVSPGNKAARNALRAFVDKVGELLWSNIHQLILDLFPLGPRDPNGIHEFIWQDVAGQGYTPPSDKPLTLVAYEAAPALRAFVVPVAVGDALSDMPLFLEPDRVVEVPLERTYNAAYSTMPRRWQRVLEEPR